MDWEELGCPRIADWVSIGNALYFDPDICDPKLVLVDESAGDAFPPLAVLPAAGVPVVWERQMAWIMTRLTEERIGREGLRQRLRLYARVAATVVLALVCLDTDGDGIPDILARLMRR